MEQKFGGIWTLIKLEILDAYLSYYTTVLKKQPYKLSYIDVFAGSGQVFIKDNATPTEGSVKIALKYPFSKFIFIDKNSEYCQALNLIKEENPLKRIEILEGDGNTLIESVLSKNLHERGVIFIDPFAMHLKWVTLEKISTCPIYDVWYLFPLMALSRNLRNDGLIDEANKATISNLLGTDEWYDTFYKESNQVSLFDDTVMEKLPLAKIQSYVIKRLETIFSKVSPNALVLKHPENNTPLFLLCFATTNPSRTAQVRAMTGANHILKKAAQR